MLLLLVLVVGLKTPLSNEMDVSPEDVDIFDDMFEEQYLASSEEGKYGDGNDDDDDDDANFDATRSSPRYSRRLTTQLLSPLPLWRYDCDDDNDDSAMVSRVSISFLRSKRALWIISGVSIGASDRTP